MTTDDSKAALAAALIESDLIRRYSEYAIDAHEFTMAREGFDVLAEQWAAAILGERGVFWATGKDEYRELIRQREAAAVAAERARIADMARFLVPKAEAEARRVALTALRAEVEGMVTGVDSMAWGSHEVWVDGESHLLAKAVLAAIDRALGDIHGTPTFSD